MRIIAKVISTYHIELLHQNGISPKFFLLSSRSSKLIPILNNYFKDFEVIIFEEEKMSWNLFQVYAHNRKVYKQLKLKLIKLDFNCLILFTDNKPYDKFLIDFCLSEKIKIELWEDGLGHYIGSGTKKTIIKNAIKFLFGFYRKGILKETYKRDSLTIKNRFDKKNIVYQSKSEECKAITVFDEILFIGQPLVEDGYISREVYINRLLFLDKFFNTKVVYLPHPREDLSKYKGTSVSVLNIDTDAESYCVNNCYKYYLSAFSTTLLNINKDRKSFYIPIYFGLTHIFKLLNNLSFLPINVVNSLKNVK